MTGGDPGRRRGRGSGRARSRAVLQAVPQVHRDVPSGTRTLSEIVPGLRFREALWDVSRPYSPWTLWRHARIVLMDWVEDGYPRVSAATGAVLMPHTYLRTAPRDVLYLDLVHELVHVRQWFQGRRLYHRAIPYSEWPTEIEAYRVTLRESHRLGRDQEWCWRYLHVPWITEEQWHDLGRRCGLTEGPPALEAQPAEGHGT